MISEQLVPVKEDYKQSSISIIVNETENLPPKPQEDLTSNTRNDDELMIPSTGFVRRMTEIGLVNSTIGQLQRVYTSSRDSSRIIRIGTNTVEFSVKLVTEKFEPQLKYLDDYAGRQLERLENSYATFVGTPRYVYNGSLSIVEGLTTSWTITNDIKSKLEETIEGLKNAEFYIDFLINNLRIVVGSTHEGIDKKLEGWSESVHAQSVEAELKVKRSRDNVNRKVVQTMKNVVDLVNNNGHVLPLSGQEALRSFLISLPGRLNEQVSHVKGQSSKVIIMANEAIVLVRSLAGILTQYLSWAVLIEECKDR